MVAVAPHHIRYVAGSTIIVERRIVSGFPFIKRLVYYKQPQFIANIEKFRRRRIVGTTNGIASKLLQRA